MPTFAVFRKNGNKEECWRVYAVDEWDARDQILRTLDVDAFNEKLYQCFEDADNVIELNVIVHFDGSSTMVTPPDCCKPDPLNS